MKHLLIILVVLMSAACSPTKIITKPVDIITEEQETGDQNTVIVQENLDAVNQDLNEPVAMTSTLPVPYQDLYDRIAALENLTGQANDAMDILAENMEQTRSILALTQPFTLTQTTPRPLVAPQQGTE